MMPAAVVLGEEGVGVVGAMRFSLLSRLLLVLVGDRSAAGELQNSRTHRRGRGRRGGRVQRLSQQIYALGREEQFPAGIASQPTEGIERRGFFHYGRTARVRILADQLSALEKVVQVVPEHRVREEQLLSLWSQVAPLIEDRFRARPAALLRCVVEELLDKSASDLGQ